MNRIYHTWDKWECYPAGLYENKSKDKLLSDDDCKKKYAEFLSDIPMFEAAMQSILLEWKNSCEHYLSNEKNSMEFLFFLSPDILLLGYHISYMLNLARC